MGSDVCAHSTDRSLARTAGYLTIYAGQVDLLSVNVLGNACFGSQCRSNISRQNVTTMKRTRTSVVASLQLVDGHSTKFSIDTKTSTARASVHGDLRVKNMAYLHGGLVVARGRTEQVPLIFTGLVGSAAPVKIEIASLQVQSTARLTNMRTGRVFAQRKLVLCRPEHALQACVFATEANGNILAQGSIQMTGSVGLQRDVRLAPNIASVAQSLGHVEAVHGLATRVVILMPRVNHSIMWFNGTSTGVISNAVARGNLSTLPIFQRRLINVSASASVGDLQIRKRYNRTYVDRGTAEQSRHKNLYISTLSTGGNSELKSLGAAGLLQVSPKRQSSNIVFSANPESGDSMVQKSLMARKQTLLNSAEFGPVQVYSYWQDFENETVYMWAEQRDKRCYFSAMPHYVCDMATHWNSYQCFSVWRQNSLDRVERCVKRFNLTRVKVFLRVPTEAAYGAGDSLGTGSHIPAGAPVRLRTLSPAHISIYSFLWANGSASLRRTTMKDSVQVIQNASVLANLVVHGHVRSRMMRVFGALLAATLAGRLQLSAVQEDTSSSGGTLRTHGSATVHGATSVQHAATFGRSPLHRLQVVASATLNNSLVLDRCVLQGQTSVSAPGQFISHLDLKGHFALEYTRIFGNLAFETAIYRTFTVQARANRIRSSGSLAINRSMLVDSIVSGPSLEAETLYIATLSGSSDAGTLLEGVTLRAGGVSRPRIDHLQAYTSRGILVDGVHFRRGSISCASQPGPTDRNQSLSETLLSVVNSGHSKYMTGTCTSVSFVHHGHSRETVDIGLSHQSAALRVETESDWGEDLKSRDSCIAATTISSGKWLNAYGYERTVTCCSAQVWAKC
jgi:hypothetical protein